MECATYSFHMPLEQKCGDVVMAPNLKGKVLTKYAYALS